MFGRKRWLRLRYGVIAHPSARLSLSSRFLCTRRGAVRVGPRSQVSFRTLFCATDLRSGTVAPIDVGSDCFIGGGSLIGPGVSIGDGAVVGGGAVVLEDVPPACVVVGNPARVIRRDIPVRPYGRFGRNLSKAQDQ